MTRTTKTITAAVAGVAAAAAIACGGPQEAEAPERASGDPVEVSAAAVSVADWPATYEAGATVRARQTAVVSARVVAPILEVRVRAGDRVRRGQTLVVLDGRELEAQKTRAAAGASGAALALQAARAEQQAAESALTLARITHERVRGLHAKDSATKAELDDATARLAGADARAAGSTARVAEAEQAIIAARAGAEAAAVGASYTTLAAPFDGEVSARHVDPGTLAAPGMPLLTIDDTTAYRLEARIDESHAQWAAAGAEVEARVDLVGADAGLWQRVRIAEVAAVDPVRHSFLIKADLPADLKAVRSGQFGRVRLLGPARRVATLPAAAIVRRGQLTFVFAIDDSDAARLRMVSVGEVGSDRVEVLAGLADGEVVVVNPPAGLADGQRVSTAQGAAR